MATKAIEASRARIIETDARVWKDGNAAKGCTKSAYLMHLPFKAVNAWIEW